ncbi:DgyrCDS325 [Dimorphilus gyrociliatus]|uniref:U3 small nucleolar RNA-associated protein 25 homolog n=1 Tax=Dimorphilus gyrociliatus TaxID=2664684 RepID=A0A7I8V466_9ANNE|nr:DgyrCDS325 [Dimorphilus gyrociliatus]
MEFISKNKITSSKLPSANDKSKGNEIQKKRSKTSTAEQTSSLTKGSLEGDREKSPVLINRNLIKSSLLLVLGTSFLFGLNVNLENNLKEEIKTFFIKKLKDLRRDEQFVRDKSETFLYALSIFYIIGGILGTVGSFILADIFGRIFAISFTQIFILIGCSITGFSVFQSSPWWLVLGKFFIGLHSGFSLVLAPVSLSEISPFNLRGTSICIHQLAITVGMIISSILSLEPLFGNDKLWPYSIVMQIVPGFMVLIAVNYLPETPRHLYLTIYDKQRAKESLRYYRKKSDVGGELEEMELERAHKLIRKEDGTNSFKRPNPFERRWILPSSDFRELISNCAFRRLIFIGMALLIIQQVAFLNLGSIFFNNSYIKRNVNEVMYKWGGIGTYFISLISTVSFLPLVDFVGRRRMIVVPISVMLIVYSVNLIFVVSECKSAECGYSILLLKNIYTTAYSIGIGPVAWISLPELFQQDGIHLLRQSFSSFGNTDTIAYLDLPKAMVKPKRHGAGGKRKKKQSIVSNLTKKQKTHWKQFGEAHPADEKSSSKVTKFNRISSRDLQTQQNIASSSSSESEEDEQTAYKELLSNLRPSYVKKLNEFEETEENIDTDLEEDRDDDIEEEEEEEEKDTEDDNESVSEEIEQKEGSDDEKSENEDAQNDSNDESEKEEIDKNDYRFEDSEDIVLEEEDHFIKSDDPFKQHFECALDESELEKLDNKKEWNISEKKYPQIGSCVVNTPKNLKSSFHFEFAKESNKLNLKPSLESRLRIANEKVLKTKLSEDASLTPFQKTILNYIKDYRDFYYHDRNHLNSEDIRFSYCVHALNHILKTRSRVISNNNKIKVKKEEVTDSHRDQGLTRPKVLIIVPFRDSALRCVKLMMSLLNCAGSQSAMNKRRFLKEYSDDTENHRKGYKPEDFEHTFNGNIDDHFRVGIGVAKKTLKIYTEFYSADILIVSPLGLRTIIGAEGDKERDFDFLSSIELLILDQVDVFQMQNWDHILHIMRHLHRQPKEAHGVDFSRVRMWCLNNLSKYMRQTLVFSSVLTPEIQSLVNKHCFNYAGKVKVNSVQRRGTICQVVVHLPQIFHRINSLTAANSADCRFEFFKSKILPKMRQEINSQTLLFVPSYFDYVRLRNFFNKEEMNFGSMCEYSNDKAIARARTKFFHSRVDMLLYTERFHFYRRYKIRGIRHLVFYSLPQYPHFYSEICNFLVDTCKRQPQLSPTCTVLIDKYDFYKLSGIVGSNKANTMLSSEKDVHLLLTDD